MTNINNKVMYCTVSIACIPVSIICVLPEMLSLMMRDVISLASKPCPVPSRAHCVLELPSRLNK